MPDDGAWRWVDREPEPLEWGLGSMALIAALLILRAGFWVLAALGLGRVTGWW